MLSKLKQKVKEITNMRITGSSRYMYKKISYILGRHQDKTKPV